MKLRSWELWYSLFHHPLATAPLIQKNFMPRRIQRFTFPETPRVGLSIGMMMAAALLCLANLGAVMNLIARLFDGLVFAALALILLIATILPGMNLALKVSSAIFNEQEKGRYDLLALTPRGIAALHWTMVMRCMRDDVLSKRLRQFVQEFATLFILPIIAGLLPIVLMALLVLLFNLRLALDFFAMVSVPLMIVGLFYVDYFQSLIIAALMSVVVPGYIYSRSGFGAAWVAPLLFTAGQIVFYTGFVALLGQTGSVVARFFPQEWSLVGLSVQIFTVFAIVVLLREATIALLWWLAVRYFDDDLRVLRID
jgi:hypothetical protein